jgi:photosystem II stability/assembly factor-like uncharacterized protein
MSTSYLESLEVVERKECPRLRPRLGWLAAQTDRWHCAHMGRRPNGVLLVLVSLVLTGCGSGVGRRTPSVGTSGRGLGAAQRCAKAARFSPGGAFAGWHIGSVHFLSVRSGVGITAESFPCFRPIRGGGAEVGVQRQPVRLAVTNDGGRSWSVTGAIVAIGPVRDGVAPEQIAALSRAEVWAVVGRGRLVATRDGGSHWQVQAVPDPVVAIAIEKGFVWAVSCAHAATRTSPLGCHLELWRGRSQSGSWTRVALPRATTRSAFAVHFAATSADVMLALTEASARPRGELLFSHDAGLHWTKRRAPAWDHNRCDNGAALTAQPPRTFWLLCLGNAAAGSSTKGLLRSTDGGRTWTTVSAVTSLTQRPRTGSIPLEEPSALAAGSQTRLWLSLTNGLAESNDGGRRWTGVPRAFDPGGWSTVIDVFDANHAWVLASGAGLWRTTDGLRWRADGPLNTG